MSKRKSGEAHTATPQQALDAALADKAGNPLRRALWLDALDRQLRPHLPPPLASRCRLANVNGEQLIFLVESSLWHARVRLAEADILVAARSIGLKATKVTVKTATTPAHSPMQQARSPSTPVSAATHKGLREALASLQDISSKTPGTTTDSDRSRRRT
ncbi:DciA family protein [Xanthomonas sp. GPE 39]|uniref:DciA family protein n=1 Tax=Xanthomonas sp. GPE 39 TaxID=1583099 RepID=UPI0005F2F60F|nr:DciA family protein [Xanthomonas sp. GPE 39]